jgi:hypothetical protein
MLPEFLKKKRRHRQMNTHKKTGVILLSLFLAAMAIIPAAWAAAAPVPAAPGIVNGTPNNPEHILPPEYFENAKPAEPLPESQMINLILSAKTVGMTGKGTNMLIEVPARYLDLDAELIASEDNPSRYLDPAIRAGDPVVLVRMPRTMFDVFVAEADGKPLTLPARQFARQYKDFADLEAHLKTNGLVLDVIPEETDPAAVFTREEEHPQGLLPVQPTPAVASLTKMMTPSAAASTTIYGEWAFFNRKNTGKSYNYLIGQIRPEYWYLSGRNDHFYIPQERETYLNNHQDSIEIVVNYQDNALSGGRGGKVTLFPAIYDNYAAYPTPLEDARYESKGTGIMTLSPATFPHAYGYHIQISNGRYYITFEDMNNLTFLPGFVYNDLDNPSTTFTDIYGSSEYIQENSPISDQFVAWTDPVIDEWARESTGTWKKPVDVWKNIGQSANVAFVHIAWNMDAAGNLITQSFADFRWA